jgi:hypothetical protein
MIIHCILYKTFPAFPAHARKFSFQKMLSKEPNRITEKMISANAYFVSFAISSGSLKIP